MKSSPAVLLLSLLLARTRDVLVSADCYFPNGTAFNNPDHRKCPNSAVCCALGRSNPPGGDVSNGPANDECLPNGLCENNVMQDGQPIRTWWRDFCSDRNWNQSTCLSICMTGSFVDVYGNIRVTPCDGTRTSEKWCCGETTDCCDKPYALVLAQTLGASPSTISSTISGHPTSTSITNSATGDPSSTATTNTPDSPSSGNLSVGAKAGIGVGVAVTGLVLLTVGFIWAKKSRSRRNAVPYESHGVEPGIPAYTEYKHNAELPVTPGELYTNEEVHELPDKPVERLT
ncbi:uncharacterized protein EI97DRAFT_155028 [Westerdykella ornata]|uniref:Mid2 domain-containing protein n=1 Tax=Westerdykella ornata TaxID=318751 RepID=A0A6A6JBL8_WESOR|nr:uncharacterized protein EI97DRAFT_155028 [Westerdykella ornata]KAF2273604.1 hypothetical protein EI97DRAFT_155028 [Westerdykella ornata]